MNNDVVMREKTLTHELNQYLHSNGGSISTLTKFLLDDSFYNQVLDVIDKDNEESNYSSFNDLEMIYLYVHQKRDLNDRKNREENTKKEYLRDLLIFYKQLVENAQEFEISLSMLERYQLLKELRHRNIRLFQSWIKHAPLGKSGSRYSVATLHRKMVIIKGFLAFLYENKYIEKPLHKKMQSSNVDNEDRPDKSISWKEVLQILNSFKHHPIMYGILTVLATTGIRVNELCTARVCDLKFIEGDYWLSVLGKGNKRREVLIHPPVLQTIESFRNRRRLDFRLDPSDDGPLFVTSKGKAYEYKYLSNYITRNIMALGLPFIEARKTPITPHYFRHGFALYSSEQGVSLHRIQEALGHVDVKTTMIYLKSQEHRKNNAAHAWKDSDLLKNI